MISKHLLTPLKDDALKLPCWILFFPLWLIATFLFCCPTAAGWIKQRQCLKMLCHPLSLPLCLRCGFSYESQSEKNSSENAVFVGEEYCCQGNVPVYRCCPSARGLMEDTRFRSDRSITSPRQGHRESVFFRLIAHKRMSVFSRVCLLPHGRPGQPAAGRLSPSTPSAPSCWSQSPPPFLCPPSLAAPSTAQWFAPEHQRRGGGGGGGGRGEDRGIKVRRMETKSVQQLFTITQYQVSILITVALNFMYMAALTGSNSQQWF